MLKVTAAKAEPKVDTPQKGRKTGSLDIHLKAAKTSSKSEVMSPSHVTKRDAANADLTSTPESLSTPQNNHQTIGSILKQARIKKDIDVFSISQTLRISERYIHAMENMDLASLPEKVYTLGFVRSYANHLGIDPDKSIAQFKEEIYQGGDEKEQKALSIPKPVDESLFPSTKTIIFAIVSLTFISTALWYWNKMSNPTPEEEIKALLETEEPNRLPNDMIQIPTQLDPSFPN